MWEHIYHHWEDINYAKFIVDTELLASYLNKHDQFYAEAHLGFAQVS